MKKSKKTIFVTIFGRFFITLLLILIQLALAVVTVWKLGKYSTYTTMFFGIGAVLMSLFIIYRDETSAYKLGWIILICLAPILGSTMYAFFGNKRPSKRIKVKLDPVMDLHKDDLKQKYNCGEISSNRLMHTINYISKRGPYPAWAETKTKYYDLADKAFPDLIRDLRNARHFIFLEYFIISPGFMWDSICDILREKAAAGVDVRVIYDDVGSIDSLPMNFAASLEKEGIKTLAFNPLRPILSLVYNNRDHRKIAVIDGYIGYSGGFNIADEYINREERFGHWKDNGIRLYGEAVWNFTVMFLNMWNAFKPGEVDYSSFRPTVHHEGIFDSDGIIQPFSDSPLDNENLGENVYLEIINQAETYVFIYTPYLIMDNEMQSAIQLAAKRGVDVRLVTPGIPDKKIVYRLTRSYYYPLLKAGVKIYEYTPGFVHAKSIIADDSLGVIGTINLDYRSLYLHFECGCLMVGSSALRSLKTDMLKTFDVSKPISTEDCRHSFLGLLFDGVLRVLSPLM